MKRPALTYSGTASGLRTLNSIVSISGDSEVLIENCRRIVECGEIKCSAEAGGFLIDVWGADLTMTSFANGNAGVTGRIQSVSVSRRSRIGGKGAE